MPSEIATAYVKIQPTATGIQGSLENMFGSEASRAGTTAGDNFASSFGNSTRQMAQTIAPVSNTARNFLSDALKVTIDFEAAMDKVRAITNADNKEFEELNKLASDLGKNTRYTSSEVAEAMSYMGMAGWKTNEILDGTAGIINLATAAGSDLASTSDIVTDALTAFGKTADRSGEMANVLASTATNSNTNVALMGETFKYVAPLCGAMGFSMQDAAIAAGLMGNAGIKGSQAGTSMKNVIQRLIKPTKESAAAMEKLGIEIDDGQGNMLSFREIMDQVRSSMGDLHVDQEAYESGLAELNKQLESGKITEDEYNDALEELADSTLKAENAQKGALAAQLAGAYGLSGLLAIVNASPEDYEKLISSIDSANETMVETTDGAIIPMSQALAEGKEWINEFDGAAEAMAYRMDNNTSGKIKAMQSHFEALQKELGEKLLPLINNFLDVAIKVVDWFGNLDEGTQTLIAGAIGVTAVAGPLLNTISLVSTGLGGIVSIGGKLIGGIPAMNGGISSLVSSAGGLTASLGGVATAATIAAGALAIAYDYNTIKEATEVYSEAAKAHEHEIDTALSSYVKLYNEKGKETADKWADMVYQIDLSGADFDQAQNLLANKIEGYWADVPQNIWDGFRGGWEYYFEGGGGGGIIGLVKDGSLRIWETAKNALGINSPSKKFEEIGTNVMLGLSNGITKGNSMSKSFDYITRSFSNFMSSFGKMDSSMSTIGNNLIVGLTNGMNKAAVDAANAASRTATSIIDAVKRAFGIASPSKVFRGIGEYLTEGLAEGISDGSGEALQAMSALNKDVMGTFSPSMNADLMRPVSYSGRARDEQQEQALQYGHRENRNLTVILELDRMQLGRAVYRLNNEETQRVGVRLAGGYA